MKWKQMWNMMGNRRRLRLWISLEKLLKSLTHILKVIFTAASCNAEHLEWGHILYSGISMLKAMLQFHEHKIELWLLVVKHILNFCYVIIICRVYLKKLYDRGYSQPEVINWEFFVIFFFSIHILTTYV